MNKTSQWRYWSTVPFLRHKVFFGCSAFSHNTISYQRRRRFFFASSSCVSINVRLSTTQKPKEEEEKEKKSKNASREKRSLRLLQKTLSHTKAPRHAMLFFSSVRILQRGRFFKRRASLYTYTSSSVQGCYFVKALVAFSALSSTELSQRRE